MTRLAAIFLTLVLCSLAWPCPLWAQQQPDLEILARNGESELEYDFLTDVVQATNGVVIKYSGSVLTAERVSVNRKTGQAIADGTVRIQRDDQVWAGEHLVYNFYSREMGTEKFRTGKAPVYAYGEGLHGEATNRVYAATNAFLTTDDVAEPAIRLRAKYIKIIPGVRLEARHAILYLGAVPVFYFPYYARNLGEHANNFNFLPGYRSSFGLFLLSSYRWFWNEELDGTLHLDYRSRRGAGAGPDLNYHLGRWGDGTFRYYYLHDNDPSASLTNQLAQNRQRLSFSYQASPFTNLEVRSLVRYQSDFGVVREFFEGEFRQDPQPSSFLEVSKFWQNFSLNAFVQPRINDFLETVERLPDLRLTGYRQQVGSSPFFYESESSAGYYRRLFPETNGPPAGLDYSAARADTYHQLLLPHTFFGWLNFTPRLGGRFTYYSKSDGPGGTNDEHFREVFNTGAEVSFKASRVWPATQSKLFEMDGLRHIIEPSVNYVYVPAPNDHPSQLPQFDYELPTLRLLPIEFPDYNAIDSIDSQNVMRFGLRNKLQTKRQGEVVNFLNWDVYTDWRLRPRHDQSTFSDVFSDLAMKPRSWLALESLTRYDIQDGQFRLAFHTLTFRPNDAWSWSLGHFYLRDDLRPAPVGLGEGDNLITSSFFYRVNENWGFRATHYFEARDGRMAEQDYTIYRDLRSWTAALTFRLRDNPTGPNDVTVAFSFSLKAFPRFGLGSDSVKPYSLLGS